MDGENFTGRIWQQLERSDSQQTNNSLLTQQLHESPENPAPMAKPPEGKTPVEKPSDGTESKSVKVERYLANLELMWNELDKNGDQKLSMSELTEGLNEKPIRTQGSQASKVEADGEMLAFLVRNFNRLNTLDLRKNEASEFITRENIQQFAGLFRQTELDRRHFAKAKSTTLENFDSIDSNRNGSVDIEEIGRFASSSSSLSPDERLSLLYLKARMSSEYEYRFSEYNPVSKTSKLPFVTRLSEYSLNSAAPLSRQELQSTSLSERVEQTERYLFQSRVADKWLVPGLVISMAATSAAFLIGMKYLGSGFKPTVPLGASSIAPMAGAVLANAMVTRLGRRVGGNFYDQHQRGKMGQIVY